MRRVRVTVSGRVQGVWFRSSCADLARELDLAGWVRNAADGSLEATFEGASDAVERIVSWCRRGPPLASVTGVAVVDEEPTGEIGFRIAG